MTTGDVGCTFVMWRGAVTGRVVTCGVCDWCRAENEPAEADVEDWCHRWTWDDGAGCGHHADHCECP